ncbi:PLD nuclease N-terminal domain-containing protein [Catellatospora tritici]|uniref:PLD nuclease N-terminal domain-containing protein n=1 Tax=Catellatospora tritici TaxID=2851566 RepID=UPI001C2DA3EA|nr:PLD nuclease N-terminal domain-containing protein [Catellatospora tritici]MBV1848779.1 PLD nuclease N-terminal domain-containing protein [Catellatospora tritici]
MTRIWLFLFLAEIALTVAALISCLSAEEGQIRALSRGIWVVIILLFSPIGAIAWFVAGREPQPRPGTWRQGSGFPEYERPRQVAPDDDPEFLRRLAKEQKQTADADRELLSKWELDLRRREDELRKRENPDG